MLISGKTIEYLTVLWMKVPDVPIVHACNECDHSFNWAAEASATGHGVIVFPDKRFTIVIGCEGFHIFAPIMQVVNPPLRSFTSHGPHTLATHEAEMPNCDDPDCEFHHPENA